MLLKLALALIVTCAVSAQILPPSGIRVTRPGPVVQTPVGAIQGLEERYELFRRIHTFKGIRYGQAPIGNGRFRQAVPAPIFPTLFQAWDYGSVCPQYSFILNRLQGEEDCLFLNIAAPTTIRTRLPVVVSIHGGGLQFGNGEMGLLGPEHITHENIIFVSMNYRLNVLGFFSTNDGNSPGNYGIKDIVLALQWVRNNIEFFGGDPDDVTIMGISGGAVAVHALVVSPAAAGLFHKALSQSGSLFNNWAFTTNPTTQIARLVQRLQLQFTNNADLMNQLRQVSTLRLLEAAGPFVNDAPALVNELRFMPVIDPPGATEMIIFPAPIDMMTKMGPINTVPYMIGFNAQESLNSVLEPSNDPTIFERFNQNPHLLVPNEWNLSPGSTEALSVIQMFRTLYFGGDQVLVPTPEHAWGWSQYISDRSFIFGISKQARLHAMRQNVFYFRFSYTGSLSFAQRLFGLGDLPGAMHGDDAFYLFRLNLITPVLPNDPAFAIQRRYVRMWTNFIRFGNPTPTSFDPIIPVTWPLLNATESFMDIGQNLSVDVHPNSERMNIWHAFDQQFTSSV